MAEDAESWEQMAQRVVNDEVTVNYAMALFATMKTYEAVGFTQVQAWELTAAEHGSRLDYMGQMAVMNATAVEEQE